MSDRLRELEAAARAVCEAEDLAGKHPTPVNRQRFYDRMADLRAALDVEPKQARAPRPGEIDQYMREEHQKALDAEPEPPPPERCPGYETNNAEQGWCTHCGRSATDHECSKPSPTNEERANTLWMDILHIIARKDEMPPGQAGYEAVQLIGAALAAAEARGLEREKARCHGSFAQYHADKAAACGRDLARGDMTVEQRMLLRGQKMAHETSEADIRALGEE